MRFPSSFVCAAAALMFSCQLEAISILISNDDGFGSGNLRQLYQMLTHAGHNGSCSFFLAQLTYPLFT